MSSINQHYYTSYNKFGWEKILRIALLDISRLGFIYKTKQLELSSCYHYVYKSLQFQ